MLLGEDILEPSSGDILLTDRTLSTPGATLKLTESDGAGLPLLLIHGTGSSRQAFAKQFDSPLAAKYRLIAPDLPGHGESPKADDPGSSYSLGGLTRATAELIEALGLRRLAVLGWSLGGHIAIELLQHPAVAGIMVIGAPPVAPGVLAMLRAFHTNWDMLLASKEHYTERDILRFFSLCFGRGGSPELLEALRRADGRVRPALVRSMMRGEMSNQRRAVEQAQVPVAIVNGREEPFMRLSNLDGLRSTIWRGRPQIIENAGHAPFWDRPEVFNPMLESFVRDVEAYSAPAEVRIAGVA